MNMNYRSIEVTTPQQDDSFTAEGSQVADLNKAISHWNKLSLRYYKDDSGRSEEFPLSFSRVEIGKYSCGTQLYYKFMKTYSILFFILMGIAIFMMQQNIRGKGYLSQQMHSSFDQATLGNQYNVVNVTVNSSDENEAKAARKKNDDMMDESETNLMLQQYPDLALGIVFLMVYIFFRVSSNAEEKLIDEQNISPADYAIQVDNLPSGGFSERDVIEHFQRFGKVHECKFAYDYEGTMPYFADILTLQKKQRYEKGLCEINPKRSHKKLEKLDQKITKLQEKVSKRLFNKFGKNIGSHKDYPIAKAFVVFERVSSRANALRVYGRYQSIRWFSKIFCRGGQPKQLLFKGIFELKIVKAVEPSNINWENQDVKPWERVFRDALVFLVVILVISFTFAMILISNVVSRNSQVDISTCKSKNSTTNATSSSSYEEKQCYCASLSLKTIAASTRLTSLCSDYLEARAIALLFTIISSSVIIVVNLLLKRVFVKLGRFQRYPTVSKEAASTLVKYFFSVFTNTAIVPIIANGNIFGFVPASIIAKNLYKNNPYVKSYPSDFDRDWYVIVGSKIMLTMVIAVISPQVINFVLIPIKKWNMKRKAKQIKIQSDLNSLYTPPKFDIVFRYSTALNIIFVCFTYSPGMPLLIIAATLTLGITYWFDKYKISRFSQKPPAYDSEPNHIAIKLLPIALLLHVACAIWAFGAPAIFPYPWVTYNDKWSTWLGMSHSNTFLDRFERSPYHVLFFVITALWLILDNFILPILYAFSGSEEDQAPETNTMIGNRAIGTFSQELGKMSRTDITTYDLEKNTNYRAVIKAMNLQAQTMTSPSAKSTLVSLSPTPLDTGEFTPGSKLISPGKTSRMNLILPLQPSTDPLVVKPTKKIFK